MFLDMNLSRDLNSNFKSYLDGVGKLSMDFSALVLTAGAWPLSQQSTTGILLPSELEKPIATFLDFYSKQHTGRRLSWLHHLAKAEVRLWGYDKRYELTVSVHQLVILMLFNDHAQLTMESIESGTKLSQLEIQRSIAVGCHTRWLVHTCEIANYDSHCWTLKF